MRDVAICYIHREEIKAPFHSSLLNFVEEDQKSADPVIGGRVSMESGTRIAWSRNKVVRSFLSTGIEWMLMVDDDMTFTRDDVVRIRAAADAKERPVVGGLCFGAGPAGNLFPTLYRFRAPEHANDSPVEIVEDYPDNALCQVDTTGAAFLLVHRSVLVKLGEVYKDDPAPWFVEGRSYRGQDFGEDWAFCLRLKQAEIPLYVHTGVKIGHVKRLVVDEAAFERYREQRDEIGDGGIRQAHKDRTTSIRSPRIVPTYVVIPQKGHVELTIDLLGQLRRQGGYTIAQVYDNGSTADERARTREAAGDDFEVVEASGETLHQMWNGAIDYASFKSRGEPFNVAFLNNDIRLGPHCLRRLSTALRADDELAAVCPNYDRRRGSGVTYVTGSAPNHGLAGFCFMVKGELLGHQIPMFDTDLRWWYGDTDFCLAAQRAGYKLGLVHMATVEHLNGGSQTAGQPATDPKLAAVIERDRAHFMAKWGLSEKEGA